MLVKTDLHIHSCLSPCGSLEMSPRAIAEKGAELGLGLMALTDHNTALNCRAFEINCRQNSIVPVFGIEVTSREEAHIVALFETVDAALDFGSFIYEMLPDIENNPEVLGDQIVVNENEEILDEVERYLGSASELSIDNIKTEIRKRNGLFIPAHIDKPVFSIPSQLGFLPPDDYDAVEVFSPVNAEQYSGSYTVISSSDAHYIDDIGKKNLEIEMEEISFQGLKKALKSAVL